MAAHKQNLPPYYNQSSRENQATNNNEIPEPYQDENYNRCFPVGRHYNFVKESLQCRNRDLYLIQSDVLMIGYNSECPLCSYRHVKLDQGYGYYAPMEKIKAILRDNQPAEGKPKTFEKLEEITKVEKNTQPPIEPLIGRKKGIQGESNSCYMDATIFCMFAYTDRFDHLLNMKVGHDIQKLQEILRNNIVYPLRTPQHGLVTRDAMYYFREELSRVTNDASFQKVERDPSEFLRVFEKLFHYSPIKTVPSDRKSQRNQSHVTSNMIWEMFDANPARLRVTKIGDIFRNSLLEIPSKLVSIPSTLILVAPRHTGSKRSYSYIIPDREIILDDKILQVSCQQCQMTNHAQNENCVFFHCDGCLEKNTTLSEESSILAICSTCMQNNHQKLGEHRRVEHNARKIELKRNRLRLFAVLCIETSHYVAFVRHSKNEHQSEWLFFDSMSDRDNHNMNVPEVRNFRDFDRWIDEAEENSQEFFERLDARRNASGSLTSKFTDDQIRMIRLFRDGAFFFYENANSNYS